MVAARVDVHHHVIPTRWVAHLERHGMEHRSDWSIDTTLALMDECQIDRAIVSVAAPGIHFGDDVEAREEARAVNEFCAELSKDRPDRFGFFACLPLPDIDGALEEAGRSLDELDADGIVLLANASGTYLGDPMFEPLMAELDGREAVAFIHPVWFPGPLAIPGVSPAAADFLLDTTRAAINLVTTETIARHPRIRFILSHAGGFVPYAAHRLAYQPNPYHGRQWAPEEVLDGLRTFYFDTALSASPSCLPSLLAFADPERILYGSDWPYARLEGVRHHTDELDRYPALDAGEAAAINHGNAERLFGRRAAVQTNAQVGVGGSR